MHKIDWGKCMSAVKNNLMVQICNMWENNHCGVEQIVQTLQLNRTTVCTYLKKGAQLNLCPSYNTTESLKRRDNKKRIALVCNERIVDVFHDSDDCANEMQNRTGIVFRPRQIQRCANGYLEHYHNFDFKYITREEYEQYKIIEQNNGVVKDGDL